MAEQQAKASSQGVDATNNSNQEARENEKNSAISNPRWEDTKGQAITKALVGDEVYLCADITDIADGTTVTIKIVEKDADGKDDPVTTLSAVVSDGQLKCKWQVTYTADDDADSQQELEEKGYTLPEYAFVVECAGVTSGESGVLEIYNWIKLQGERIPHKILLVYVDGSFSEIRLDNEEIIIHGYNKIGDCYIHIIE